MSQAIVTSDNVELNVVVTFVNVRHRHADDTGVEPFVDTYMKRVKEVEIVGPFLRLHEASDVLRFTDIPIEYIRKIEVEKSSITQARLV